MSLSLKDVHDFELSLVEPCMAMLERGVLIDVDRLRQMHIDLDDAVTDLRRGLQELIAPLCKPGMPDAHLFFPDRKKKELVLCAMEYGAGSEERVKKFTKAVLQRYLKHKGAYRYNPDSDKQTKTVLYSLLKLPKRMRDGKLRVDEDALKDLRAHDKSGVVSKLLDINKKSTIFRILTRMDPDPKDGRLRTWLNPAGTETGRMSSAGTFLERSTNLQNIPKKVGALDPAHDVRNIIVPDEGEVFLEADLSQAEARVTAALCKDRELLKKWVGGKFDVHRWTGAHIFGKPERDITDQERDLGKMCRHALNYGMGWKTFQAHVNSMGDVTGVSITAAEAKRLVRAYHRLHPRLERWWRRVQTLLGEAGRLSTPFGRTRIFHGRRRADSYLDETHKEAIAFVPQSTVADLLNRGLLRWWSNHDRKVGRLLLQVHDSILVSVPKARQKLAARLLKKCLEEEISIDGIKITIPADVKASGESWAKVK